MKNFKMWLMATVILGAITTISATMSCDDFAEFVNDAKELLDSQNERDRRLENLGLQAPDDVFGADPTIEKCSDAGGKNAELHTFAAQVYQSKYGSLADFSALASRCGISAVSVPAECNQSPAQLPKYRSIDGRGYNTANAEFGASDTPFRRFAPTGYQDGTYTPRKSVTGRELPNVRDLVQNVLRKCERTLANEPLTYSVFALMTVLFITHDAHYQTPNQPTNVANEISCCKHDNSDLLPDRATNSHCLAIQVPKNDSFYAAGNIGCMNLVRSQTAEYTGQVQTGQPMNRATSYLDLSLIYGNHQSESDQIRSYSDGQLRMGPGGILPVDKNGKYIPSMSRFTTAPFASVWPSLFAQNHNTLAEGLKAVQPNWSDEILFQEARRINIAIFQYNLITSKAVENSISGIPIDESYHPGRSAATSLEFSIAYRGPHYYLRDEMLFLAEDGTETPWLQSDTMGRIDILEKGYEDAVRGAASQIVNAVEYGNEVTSQIGKNSAGYGKDIISIDIQRSRDQGTPTYLQVRRQCNLTEVNSFNDLRKILNPVNVALLEAIYEDVKDIDYYVGGMLEIFDKLGNPLVGPTFGCVIADQWNHFAGGDVYYYLNPSSPHPFTAEQIKAIQQYSISHMVCANTNIQLTPAIWPYAPAGANPLVPCSNFPPFNFTAFQ